MGSSFVDIDDKGFWMRDGALELWLRLLALHLEEPQDRTSCSIEIRNGWLLASRGYFSGCISVKLDEAVSTEEGKRVVVAGIHSLMTALTKAPKHLHPGFLNILGIEGGEFIGEYETERLLEVGQAFLDLIDGKIQSTAADTSFMPGSMRL